jgi:hypothetical protein
MAIVVCGVLGTLLPAAYGLLNGIPEPLVHDEFSYLLGADTFAHGRLTNPSPPLPEFFEAPHVLVVPSYASKYPPGQALVLAVGQVLTGRPIWGVWLSCGLFAASLCWMLQAWCARQWALAVTVLTIMTLGLGTYWAQSYWGGMPAASGAALLFGGLLRILRIPRVVPGVLMGLGVVVLANTRPYEGLLSSLPAVVIFAKWLLFDRRSALSERLVKVLVPASLVLAVGVASMVIYNHAVTGDAETSPYVLHNGQYLRHGVFVFSGAHEPRRRPADRVSEIYRYYEAAAEGADGRAGIAATNVSIRFFAAIGTPFGLVEGRLAPGYLGAFLWILVLLPRSRLPSRSAIVVIALLAGLAECVLLWWWPTLYLPVFAAIVVTLWIVNTLDLLAHGRQGTLRLLVAAVVIVVLGESLVWWWWRHYSAPIVPLVLALAAGSAQRLARRTRVASVLGVGTLVMALLVVHVLMVFLSASVNGRIAHADRGSLPQRASIVNQLERQAGRHLVFVRYEKDFPVDDEWVYNAADLTGAKVIFAHDLGDERNGELMATNPGRAAWLVKVSRWQTPLEPYVTREPRR